MGKIPFKSFYNLNKIKKELIINNIDPNFTVVIENSGMKK